MPRRTTSKPLRVIALGYKSRSIKTYREPPIYRSDISGVPFRYESYRLCAPGLRASGCALLGAHVRYLVLLEAAVLLLTQRGVGVAQYFTHARGGQKVVVTCPGVVDALAEPHDLDLTYGSCELVVH